jgi:hypothetical protein
MDIRPAGAGGRTKEQAALTKQIVAFRNLVSTSEIKRGFSTVVHVAHVFHWNITVFQRNHNHNHPQPRRFSPS